MRGRRGGYGQCGGISLTHICLAPLIEAPITISHCGFQCRSTSHSPRGSPPARSSSVRRGGECWVREADHQGRQTTIRERGCEALLFLADAKGHPHAALKGEHRTVDTPRVLPLRSSLRSFNAKRTLWNHELFTAPWCTCMLRLQLHELVTATLASIECP